MDKKNKISEREVQKQSMDYLKLKGWDVYRINNGAVWNAKNNCWVYHGTPGVSDVLAINKKQSRLMFIEMKSSIGKLSTDQKKFLELVDGIHSVRGICVSNFDNLLAELSDK